jgi:hypothetical protein
MSEQEAKHWISVGMGAAYGDICSRLQHKIDTLYKAIDQHPQHAEFYEEVIDIVTLDLEYAKTMLTVSNKINKPTMQ